MAGKASMAGVRLEETELMEAWSAENDDVRARFDFPPTAASGCTSCSVIYYSQGGIIALGLTKPDQGGKPAHSAKTIVDLYETWGPRTFSRSIGQRLRTCNGILREKYSCAGFNEVVAE